MNTPIKVHDAEGQLLFACSFEEHEKAFQYAKQMEEMGIEVTLTSPSVPESLGMALGINQEQQDKIKEELDNEIQSHDYGCCLKES